MYVTLAHEKDLQNILQRLVYEEKYKLTYYTVLESVVYQYGGMYVPNFLLLFIAHFQRRKLNYDVVN